MNYTISDIAKSLGAEFFGDGSFIIDPVSEPIDADSSSLALAMNEKYLSDIKRGSALAAIVPKGINWKSLNLRAVIVIDRPRHAMSSITKLLDKGSGFNEGIHPTSVVEETAIIGKGASIGPFSYLGANVKLGNGVRLGSHVVLSEGSKIGNEAIIGNGVIIEHNVIIGDNFRSQAGSVIGSDGFSFVTKDESDVEIVRQKLGKREVLNKQAWLRIHSLGSVKIGNDVEIGANVSIDRGTIRNTIIGDRSKLDNLVHVGHNVKIGMDCLICGQVGIAGSATIGDRVILGGQCGVNDNIFVGDDVIAGGATKIFTNAPKGRVLLGYPAVKMDTHISIQKALRRLPRFMKKLS